MAIVYCVLCGTGVDVQDYLNRVGLEYPPSCNQHQQEVQEEVDKDLPMWPSHFYGECWKHDTQGWMVKVSPGKPTQSLFSLAYPDKAPSDFS